VKTEAFLARLEMHGIKLGLGNTRRLLDAAGNPQNQYPSVHVAGTNGKGSVLAMLDAMFRTAGYSTARFSKPHLLHLNERFLSNGAPIDDAQLEAQIAFFQEVVSGMDPPPTYFEVVTSVALRWFAQCAPDVALIEVGMGGRFDATNVLCPVASAITNISFDHTQYLGNTLEAIAFEKAGIIKQATPVVVGETLPGPRNVIARRAEELGSPLILMGRDFNYATDGENLFRRFTYEGSGHRIGPVTLGLAGGHQGENAAVAVALADTLRERFPRLSDEAVARGLAEVRWPCRLEKVLDDPPVIVDGAHNPAGAACLAAELPPSVIMLAVAGDKDAKGVVEALAPIAHELILTQFSGRRALPVDALCGTASVPHERFDSMSDAIAYGLERASAEHPLVIAGSVMGAGEARKILVEHHGAAPLRF